MYTYVCIYIYDTDTVATWKLTLGSKFLHYKDTFTYHMHVIVGFKHVVERQAVMFIFILSFS